MAYDIAQRVADRVKTELAARGQRQTDLAEFLGITQPMISRRLAGKYDFPLRDLTLIAEFFGITVSDLLGSQAVGESAQHTVSPAHPGGAMPEADTAGPTRRPEQVRPLVASTGAAVNQ